MNRRKFIALSAAASAGMVLPKLPVPEQHGYTTARWVPLQDDRVRDAHAGGYSAAAFTLAGVTHMVMWGPDGTCRRWTTSA